MGIFGGLRARAKGGSEISRELSFRSAVLSREESAVVIAQTGFLASKLARNDKS
jgi:hypothetical protein